MTSPKGSLFPASGDDRRTLLSALELVACRRVQLAQSVGAVVGQGMTFEPGPQVLDGIHVRRVRWQEGDLNVAVQTVEVLAHQATAMRLQAISDHQQRLFQVGLERLEEFDDLFFLDAALVQTEQAVGTRQSGNNRDVRPIEVKLNDRCLAFGRPRAHSGWALAESGLVDKNDQATVSLGFF